jgi:hypothetical protein
MSLIALQKKDASLVARDDKSECDRIRNSFLKKKPGLSARAPERR